MACPPSVRAWRILRGWSPASSLAAWLLLMLLLSVPLRGAEEGGPGAGGKAAGEEIPASLRSWAAPEYPRRIFLKVEAPPMAGAIELLPDPDVAHIHLPLRLFPLAPPVGPAGEGAGPSPLPSRVENLLVLGQDGSVQPVFVRPVAGGSEVEVAFPTQSGFRRYCLYHGAKEGLAAQFSPLGFQPKPLRVRVLGQHAPASFVTDSPAPLTLKRFEELPANWGPIGTLVEPAIDHLEPPFERSTRADYVARYEAFLRAPASGAYGFAVATFGAACLLVDGAEVLGAERADPTRDPFALRGVRELKEGLHRVTLYHAQLGERSGVRLYWRPPGQEDFLAVPPLSFCRALPAVALNAEQSGEARSGILHLERLAHCRVNQHRGAGQAREWVALLVEGRGPSGERAGWLRITSGGQVLPLARSPLPWLWVPAGVPVQVEHVDGQGRPWPGGAPARTLTYPSRESGATEIQDVAGSLELKDAPTFLFPDETGQLHLEAQWSPIPRLYSKERVERGPKIPAPLPSGSFRVRWRLEGLVPDRQGGKTLAGEREVTPGHEQRRKLRIPLEIPALLEGLEGGTVRFLITLSVGGVEVETRAFRILHARGSWPANLRAGLDGLYATEELGALPSAAAERVLVVVPRENPVAYRRFAVPRLLAPEAADGEGAECLFLGDPLVDLAGSAVSEEAVGLAGKLAPLLPGKKLRSLCLAGPHRGWFVFRLLAETERYLRQQKGGKVPGLVVVSVGGGDARCQTPLHLFERGLDVLVDRLRGAGAERILFLGIVPEPGRKEQGERYQERWLEVVRQHHLQRLDLFQLWTREEDWLRRFRIDPENESALGAVPNAEALEELARRIKEELP